MAKQTGDYKITGTYDGVTYYQMDGEYYARAKSSLKGSRVKRDPRFRRTMEWARRLAKGSQLASGVYRSLPRQEQAYSLYQELKSLAIQALKEGMREAEVVALLRCRLKESAPPTPSPSKDKSRVILRPVPTFTRTLLRVRGDRRKKGWSHSRRLNRLDVVPRE
jgi:hypothetical protein